MDNVIHSPNTVMEFWIVKMDMMNVSVAKHRLSMMYQKYRAMLE